MKVGDRVTVTLPSGAYAGRVTRVLPNYNWTDDTWYEVQGNDPEPFVTTTRSPKMADPTDI